MTAASNCYANTETQALQGKIAWLTGTIKMALMATGYTPNLATNIHWSDISSNEVSGTGYSAGGTTLASLTAVVTAANSWATTWVTLNPQVYGDVIRPTVANGFVYMAVQNGNGTTGASQPTFPTVVGETVTDGTVTWCCMGQSITVFSSAAASWSNATLTAFYGVVYDASTGVAATEPLINLQTFAGAETSTSGTFQVSPDPTYGWFYTFAG